MVNAPRYDWWAEKANCKLDQVSRSETKHLIRELITNWYGLGVGDINFEFYHNTLLQNCDENNKNKSIKSFCFR